MPSDATLIAEISDLRAQLRAERADRVAEGLRLRGEAEEAYATARRSDELRIALVEANKGLIAQRDSLAERLAAVSRVMCSNDTFPGDLAQYVRNDVHGRELAETERDSLAERVRQADEQRPYWLWRSMLEEVAGMCWSRDIDGAVECKETGDCITEWCPPCAAAKFLDDIRKAEAPAPPSAPAVRKDGGK